jgi:hypothetical protein
MAIGYQVFAVRSFPQANRFVTEDQLTLDLNSEHTRETSSTTVEGVLGDSSGYTQYSATHDYLVRLKYPARAQGKQFREYVTPYEFPTFLGRSDTDIGFRPFLIRTKKLVAQDFVARLNRKVTGFSADHIVVDFATLRPRCPDVRGAWFGGITAPNISRAAVFGPNVDRSDEFQHAESVGQLTNIMVQTEIQGVTHLMMFVAHGGVVLYDAYASVEGEVEVIHAALGGVLKGCLSIAPQRRGA